jgi:hypothetical protein
LARKPNYNFEKRKKEDDRKAKRDAKRDEKRRKREALTAEPEQPTPPAGEEVPALPAEGS